MPVHCVNEMLLSDLRIMHEGDDTGLISFRGIVLYGRLIIDVINLARDLLLLLPRAFRPVCGNPNG